MNILVYRLGSLGDTVVALPCFYKIAASFPGSKRFLLTNVPVSVKAAPAELVLKGTGLIDAVISYPIGIRSPGKLAQLLRRLRSYRFDAAVYLTQPRGRLTLFRDYLFLKSCGIKAIYGIPFRSDLYSNRRENDVVFEYEAQRLARCMRPLGAIDLDDSSNWDLNLNENEKSTADEALQATGGRPVLAVNIGGKLAVQDWGDTNWLIALDTIKTRFPQLAMVFVGSADERNRVDGLLRNLNGAGINLCGKLTPRETAAVFDRSVLFLGHDSGPMHLAASRQIQCVGLFGSNNPPKIWHPYGSKHIVFHEQRGIGLIPPAAVIDALESIFKAHQLTPQGHP